MKNKILNYFDHLSKIKSLSEISKFFNELTLELIKTFFLLLQFGFFNSSKIERQYYKSKAKEMNFGQNNYEEKNFEEESLSLKKILKILAFLLEFDEDYFQDLKMSNIKRGINFIKI